MRGGGRYVDDIVLPGMAFGYVLRSPHAHARIRAIATDKARAAPGVLAVLTGADWVASGWGDLPVPGGMKRRDGSPMYRPRYPALVSERVRWVGDYVAFVVAETYLAGRRRRRADRGRLRAAARRRLDGGRRGARRAAGVGRLSRQRLLRPSRRRCGRDRCRLRRRRPRGARPLRRQPRHRRDHGAARLDRRLQRRRWPLHHLHDAAACPSVPRRARPQRAQGAGEPRAGRRARHRRQLRHEVRGLQRGGAGAARLEDAAAPGEVGVDALRGVSERCPGARQRHRCRACARCRRHLPRPAGEEPHRGRRLSADRDDGRGRQSRHARRRLSHAGDPRRRHRRVQPHQSDPPLSRQRPPGGGLRDRADGRSRRR